MIYEILAYQPCFREQIVELQRHLWGPDLSLNARYFDWKYLQNPFLPDPLIYLALSRGKVVAMRGFMGAKWRFGRAGRAHDCPIACDAVVEPAHRGTSLFRELMAFALDDLERRGYRYLFNLSANPGNHKATLKSGWRSVTSYETLRRETPRGSLAWTTRQRMRKMPLFWRFSDRAAALLSGRAFGALTFEGRDHGAGDAQSLSNDSELQHLVKSAEADADDGRLGPLATPAYFAWRFLNPMHESLFLFGRGSRPRGYLVLQRRRDDPLGMVRIVDWARGEKRAADRDALLELAEQHCPLLSIWSTSLDEATKAMLSRRGFKAMDESRGVPGYRPGLLVKALGPAPAQGPLDLDGRDLLDPRNWKLSMICSDAH